MPQKSMMLLKNSKSPEQHQKLMDKYYVGFDKDYDEGKKTYEYMKTLDNFSFAELLKDESYDYISCVKVLYYINMHKTNKNYDLGFRILTTIMKYVTTYVCKDFDSFYDFTQRLREYSISRYRRNYPDDKTFTIEELELCLTDW